MLTYESVVPAGVREGAPLVVLLHGRGADRYDLLGLAPILAPEAVVVSVQAPHAGPAWGYGPGWAWYRFHGTPAPDPESFAASQRALGEFLGAVRGELPVRTGPLALGGFSQGGTVSLAHALRNPGTVPAVLCFSGFLPDHLEVEATPETVRGTHFFWGHGTMDPSVPFAWGESGRARLREAGADLEARDYPIGHSISQDEADDARRWLASVFAAEG